MIDISQGHDYIAVIIVTFKRPKDLKNLVECLLQQEEAYLRITIVDNSLDASMSQELMREFSRFDFIQTIISSENIGYARGNNLGVNESIKKWGKPTHIVISNDDILLSQNYVIKQLKDFAENNINAGCIQPRISMINGSLQGPYSKSKIWVEVLQYLLPPLWFILKLRRQNILKSTITPVCCYRVMGAFFLIKLETFLQVGMFDKHTFLGREEEILAYKLTKVGFISFYLPSCDVVHLQLPKSLPSESFFSQSDDYFYKHIMKVNTIELVLYKFSRMIFYKFYLPILKKIKGII